MKRFIITGLILALFILVLPATLVAILAKNDEVPQVSNEVQSPTITDLTDLSIAVYRSKENVVEKLPLEQYVIGVVASEMPVQFQLEALKAQALAARTYIVKQMLAETDMMLPQGAIVTDTMNHQVFQNEQELRKRWGKDFDWKMARIKEAVESTRGQIITYNGEPIEASFFSTSNGFTENSEDYWQNSIPYLRSVASPWDTKSPKYKKEIKIPLSEFEAKLGVHVSNPSVGEITERTSSNRVKTVVINGKRFTGREIREKLRLDSTDFTWQQVGNDIVIQTKGWGHGVGMSQYGADGMAKEGKTYDEIVQYFYQGVKITTIDPYLAKLTAKMEETQ